MVRPTVRASRTYSRTMYHQFVTLSICRRSLTQRCSSRECRAVPGCGLCLLGNLLDHPKEEVGGRLFDPEPFQLGGDLPAVVGGVIDNVAQQRPRRQGRRAAALAQRQHGVEPLRRGRLTQILEAAVGTLPRGGASTGVPFITG